MVVDINIVYSIGTQSHYSGGGGKVAGQISLNQATSGPNKDVLRSVINLHASGIGQLWAAPSYLYPRPSRVVELIFLEEWEGIISELY